MRPTLFIFCLVTFTNVWAQSMVSSQVSVRTCMDNNECSSMNSSAYLFYDEPKNAFYLKIDFNKLRIGNDSLDYWLNDLSESNLYFKAPLLKEDFPSLSGNHAKTVRINGRLFLNGVWHSQTVELSLFSTENSSLNFSQTPNQYANYKVNFGFAIVPKDYKIHKKSHHLTNTIFVSVGLGQINMLEPGMEAFLAEAYYH